MKERSSISQRFEGVNRRRCVGIFYKVRSYAKKGGTVGYNRLILYKIRMGLFYL